MSFDDDDDEDIGMWKMKIGLNNCSKNICMPVWYENKCHHIIL